MNQKILITALLFPCALMGQSAQQNNVGYTDANGVYHSLSNPIPAQGGSGTGATGPAGPAGATGASGPTGPSGQGATNPSCAVAGGTQTTCNFNLATLTPIVQCYLTTGNKEQVTGVSVAPLTPSDTANSSIFISAPGSYLCVANAGSGPTGAAGTNGTNGTNGATGATGATGPAGLGGFTAHSVIAGAALNTVYHNTSGKTQFVTVCGYWNGQGGVGIATDSSTTPTSVIASVATYPSPGTDTCTSGMVYSGNYYKFVPLSSFNLDSASIDQ